MKIGRFEITLHEKERKLPLSEQVNNLRTIESNNNIENVKALAAVKQRLDKIEANVELMSRILNKMQNGNK